MQVMFTSSARSQLLELVATLRSVDRNRAARFVDAMESRVEALADGTDSGRAIIRLTNGAPDGADAIRLCYWIRADVLWVLALFSEMHPRDCSG